MKTRSYTGIAVVALLFANFAAAEEPGERKNRRGPPQVAVDACAAAVEGDACSFEGRHGKSVSGTCAAPAEDMLVCRPEGGRPRLWHREHDQDADNPE